MKVVMGKQPIESKGDLRSLIKLINDAKTHGVRDSDGLETPRDCCKAEAEVAPSVLPLPSRWNALALIMRQRCASWTLL